MSTKNIQKIMGDTGVVPVFYHSDLQVSKEVIDACFSGGIRVFEFTNRGPEALEIFQKLVEYVQELKGLSLGIGSIVDAEQAKKFIAAGADFIVSPILNKEVAEICKKHDTVWVPGCGTATEIYNAQQLGADLVKVFPASQVGGPEFIKAIKAPMPWSKLMPTGGVTTETESLKSWLKAGAHCVGIGSALFSKNNLGQYDYEAIKKNCSVAISTIKDAKGE